MRFLRAWFQKLIGQTSGNTTVLVAIGLPMLLGSSGLAIDLAQWYMWKNELQYAVDQAAIAGAWSRAKNSSSGNYVDRARQEFWANLSTTRNMSPATPSVSLANYASGVLNSVTVVTTLRKTLPFTGIVMGRGVTIRVSAQASFKEGLAYTSCLIATNASDPGAVTIGGNSTLTAACGIASLSTDVSSIIVNGSPTVSAGWVVSAGGIDDWFNLHTNDEVHEYMTNLYDPFKDLSPPNNPTPRTYACSPPGIQTKATVTTTVATAYAYYKGSGQNNATLTTYDSPQLPSSFVNIQANVTVPNGTLSGSTSSSSTTTWTQVDGSGSNKIYEVKTTTTSNSYSNVVATTLTQPQASLSPGTYTGGFRVSCTTVMSSGIYVIDGGGLEITGQYQVTGAGVMFVLKNGAFLKIAGGSAINLTAPTSSQLVSAGLTSTQAQNLSGMLVFEDRNSSGSNQSRLNGTASTVLNGTLYFPVSTLNFAGTVTVTSQCLMIAADNIIIEGTADMSTFCPAGMTETTNVSSGSPEIKLVS